MSDLYSKIISCGSYLPEKVLTNHDLAEIVDTSHDWIYERTGIVQRHIAAENESSVDMAYNASLKAMSLAELRPDDIDMIIVATATPERKFPSTAVLLQNSLKIEKAFAFDVNAACTGFVYALDVADKYIQTKIAKNILIVGTEKMSSLLDWKDRNTCVLFGDGAGAIILSESNKQGILSTSIGSNGAYKDLLTVNIDSEFIEMKGNDVFKIAVKTMGKLAMSTLQKNNIDIDEIDWLIPHQANSRIINAIAKKISLPREKIVLTVDRHGNTSAASIPLAFDDAYHNGSLREGDLIMLEAFGAGFTWGSALLKF
ncbi:MAG: ketoacyl-ACP synthase III [Gammaproteobacteria bacterium]|jgi:3-oxoacyl-[acyl-carrier-protein] synthase III|nr:ketoacyl-ACP synthase III [Gammaproteobacteria bacterium]MBT4461993.1 ketoacyl-ACP synthase III [Gammaproteobacteria bacterium]MBT4654505.1 ketoacyl-ACP synthase III [Gammaproteobacteria bacterium]MBT5761446.1 ketoacyl-ACP synthase III [Gammaproteobacteria bacterium]MBT6332009.1 ketoacyl-ACP synthase III [Gammaproteobacteria bacterium]